MNTISIEKKKITTIVSDFDGTILRKGMVLPSKEFFRIVKRLINEGYRFVAASGRQYANLRRIVAPIAEQIDFIAENGCLVVCGGKVIYKLAFTEEQVHNLLQDTLRYPEAEVLASGEKTGYVVPHHFMFPIILRMKYRNNVTVLKSFTQIDEEVVKVAMHFDKGIPDEAKKWFKERYDDTMEVVDSGNGWLDFNPKGSGKGAAMGILAEHLGISTDEMMAFGDSENDITMLQRAGISYAVDTAKPHVKESANHICVKVEEVLAKLLT